MFMCSTYVDISTYITIICPKYFILVLQKYNFSLELYVPLKLASEVSTGYFVVYLSKNLNMAANGLRIVLELT